MLRYSVKCICAHLHAFASLSGVFSPLLSLKYITYSFFCLSALSVPSLLPCSSSLPSSTPEARGHPCSSLPCLPSACPLLLLPVVCSVAAVCLLLCPRPRGLFRPAFCVSCRVSCCLSVTRQPSGAKRCDSVGRCTAYISPALSPLARHVLPCVPLSVPCLVLWLPSVCPCVCPAACCRLVVVIAGTPLCPERRRCGAASAM